MDKAIILISGTPQGKTSFEKIAKETCWLWNANACNFLGKISKQFYWDGERSERQNKFIGDLLTLVNSNFDFERKYIKNIAEKFIADTSEVKTEQSSKKNFERFLLIIHGISKELIEEIEGEFGAFQLHITSRKQSTNIEGHDYCLYEDDDNFVEEANRVIRVLTNTKKENN